MQRSEVKIFVCEGFCIVKRKDMVRVAPVHRTGLEIKAWAHGDGVGRPIQGLGDVMDPGQ